MPADVTGDEIAEEAEHLLRLFSLKVDVTLSGQS
jgi:hypothetical protein